MAIKGNPAKEQRKELKMLRIDLPHDSFIEIHENFFNMAHLLSIPLLEVKNEVDWKQNHLNIQGKEIPFPRLTCYYGEHPYKYSGIVNPARPMPNVISLIANRVRQIGYDCNAVLCNYYRDGNDSIGWHSDDEKEMPPGHVISSLSLGDSRTFKIKPKIKGAEYFSFQLKNADLFVMGGKFQQHYLHHIGKEANKGERINLTFRIIQPI